jgi:hypothetical protein
MLFFIKLALKIEMEDNLLFKDWVTFEMNVLMSSSKLSFTIYYSDRNFCFKLNFCWTHLKTPVERTYPSFDEYPFFSFLQRIEKTNRFPTTNWNPCLFVFLSWHFKLNIWKIFSSVYNTCCRLQIHF